MSRIKKENIIVYCKWCLNKIFIKPCHYRQRITKNFYCNRNHHTQYRNKYNNPSKRDDVKKKIGKASKERGAIYIALNSINYKNRKILKGKENPAWKDEISYKNLHKWLKTNFGKADKCENKECKETSYIFQWAKLKDKKYERKRNNFIMLCASCHSIYDGIIFNIKKNKNNKLNRNLYDFNQRRTLV